MRRAGVALLIAGLVLVLAGTAAAYRTQVLAARASNGVSEGRCFMVEIDNYANSHGGRYPASLDGLHRCGPWAPLAPGPLAGAGRTRTAAGTQIAREAYPAGVYVYEAAPLRGGYVLYHVAETFWGGRFVAFDGGPDGWAEALAPGARRVRAPRGATK